jgi:predicted dienelactone hydrolase
MLPMRRLLPFLLTMSLLAAACGDDTAGETSPDPTTTVDNAVADDTLPDDTLPDDTLPEASTTTAPTKAEIALLGRGEYTVGVSTITITDTTRDRPLTVDVWFPVVDDAAGDAHRYSFITGDYYESPLAISADAAALATDGPFPLVVYSHGSGGVRFIHSDYTETIASHGYVVVAPDHTGNTAVERIADTSDDPALIALNRPLDVRAVIDAFLDPTDAETTPFQSAIDADHIVLTGHSFGGFTTYATSAGYENAQGAAPADDRIDALIPLAPAVGSGGDDSLLSDDDLARVAVPALVIVGTDDKTTPLDPNVTRAWELTNSEPQYRLELIAGEHQSFTDLCAYLDFFDQLEAPTPIVVETVETMAVEGCSADDMASDRVQDLTNTFAVTFLDSVFGDAEMFTPEAFVIPDDVNYLAK